VRSALHLSILLAFLSGIEIEAQCFDPNTGSMVTLR
jgi:hypothetical protein